MKKLLPSLLLVLSAAAANAQSVTFSVPVVPCNSDGVITASFTGLTPPLTVEWHTEGTTGATIVHTGVTSLSDGLTGYSGGPVSVTASDGTGFAVDYFPGTPPLTYTLTTTGAVCPALGTINATVAGGTSPYTYQWYNKGTGAIVASGNPATLPTGVYGVIVTDGAGCSFGSRYLNDTGLIPYTSFTATVTATDADCTDGTATVAAVDPSAILPLSYVWSTGATTPTISGLSRGNYTVEIIDALGCRASSSPAGFAYTPYSVFVNQTTLINVPATTTPATCTSSDGAIATFAAGGTAPYTYSWSNGAITASQTGLVTGNYHVTVTDANGCIGEASFLVNAATPIVVTSSSSPSLCTSPTGNASIVPAGGTPPYTTLWYTTPAQTSATATLLPAGTYNFRVTDAAGCVQTGAVTVPPINAVNGMFTSTAPLCMLSNGTIGVTPSGGATPYTYLWSTGATTASITSVPAGYYSVRITDNMGCKKTIPFNLVSYSPVGVGLSVTDASCMLNNDGGITATPYGGTPPYSYGWSTGGTTPSITGLATGYYGAFVSDASGCTAHSSAYVDYNHSNTSCYCTIEGTIYNDANNNCTQDPGEAGINHAQVFCTGIGYTYTNAAGHYSFIVPSGTYTITETVVDHYPLSPCQLNNIPVTATAATACVHTVDFANGTIPVHNLRISGSTLTPPVPGNTHVQKVVVVNEGTLSEDTLQVRYRTDGQLLAPTALLPSGMLTGGSNLYTSTTVPPLAAGAYQEFIIAYNTPTNIPLGTVVNNRDTVGYDDPAGASWITDNTPANNVCHHPATVVASYDPNFKEVTPKGSGTNGIIFEADSVLEYTVHFQNTGSWYAQNIVVIDTLDADLDWTTLHPLYESAPCKVSVYSAGALKVAKFTFNNINLPPQMFDDLRSTGMFTYSIETMPGLALGTQFKNSASIYFDYNAPIKTNTTLNTLGSPGSVAVIDTKPMNEDALTVYPNPANNLMHAVINTDNAGAALMTITDVAGKVMQNRIVNLTKGMQTITTDISQYAPGIYFVNVNANGLVHSQKLVVIK